MSERKRQALEKAGLLNTRAHRVHSPLFERLEFFDAHDKLQVKYEMLRSHEVDQTPISRAAELFGYTRQAYHQIREAFQEEGMSGLAGKKRGRKGPVTCTPEVVGFLVEEKQRHPKLTGRELAERLLAEKGVEVHKRTVEKIVAGLSASRSPKRNLRRAVDRPQREAQQGQFLEAGGGPQPVYEALRSEALGEHCEPAYTRLCASAGGASACWACCPTRVFRQAAQSCRAGSWSRPRQHAQEPGASSVMYTQC